MSMSLSAVFRRFLPEQPIPKELQKTFIHLFIEMSWIGVLGGTTLSFLSVYAARLGGTPNQIGLISAVPALVNLLFAIPANGLIRGRPLGLTSFWGAALARIFYLSFALLPIFFAPRIEVWVIILVTLIMNIPLTVLNVSFNAMMIESIPGDWRAFVVGTRNALLSVFQLIFQLLSGLVLKNMDFPIGYQVVFFAGFLGAAMSTVHLFYLRRLGPQPAAQTTTPSKGITWRAWLP
ncbi:MAG: hypothetical protein HY835_14795, partial [Anaerolineae bacterium]|nr:hypothetical protein [Anaerolineae bacterium]